MTEHEIALRSLSSALEDFLDSGCESEGSTDEHEHAGVDPNEVDFESVEKDGEIWKAVIGIRPFYGKNILSFPNPRKLWQSLKRVCRYGLDDPFEHQTEAHTAANEFQTWVKKEVDKINSGSKVCSIETALLPRPNGSRPNAILNSKSEWVLWEDAIYLGNWV